MVCAYWCREVPASIWGYEDQRARVGSGMHSRPQLRFVAGGRKLIIPYDGLDRRINLSQ
jgi:hypothetical protein